MCKVAPLLRRDKISSERWCLLPITTSQPITCGAGMTLQPIPGGLAQAGGWVDSGSPDLGHEWDKSLQDRFPSQGVKTAMPSALGGGQDWASRSQSSDCTSTSAFTQTVSFLSLFFGLTVWHAGSSFPDRGWSLCPLQWKHRFLTTGRPETSQTVSFLMWAWKHVGRFYPGSHAFEALSQIAIKRKLLHVQITGSWAEAAADVCPSPLERGESY